MKNTPLSLLTLGLICFVLNIGFAQNDHSKEEILLVKTEQSIKIDGNIDEAAWFSGKAAEHFWQYFPNDSTEAEPKTEIFMTYDDKNLYIAAKCYSNKKKYITPSLRRDFRAGGNDNITFLIDPFQDNTNAFVFGMNPFGVMREALISNGGNNPRRDWNGAWDNKWTGFSAVHEGYWACEISIPFSTIRFKEGSTQWNFNSYRFDTQTNTLSTWQQIPREQIIMTLAHMGAMTWDEPLQKSGTNISIIPYVSGAYAKNTEEGEEGAFTGSTGVDAKIGITSGLNLDLTVNPDFSQVEVDRQVTNLDRFEIFFPERRQFFLENMDLFSSFGTGRVNPFFSRRIGSAYNTVTEKTEQVPILFGARLSGKLDNNWRIGLMNVQTRKQAEVPAFNQSVAVLQRKVFSRSNIGLIFVNKQTLNAADSLELDKYNRVIGLDYVLASKNNKWNGNIFYHQGLTPDSPGKQFAHGVGLQYTEREFVFNWRHSYVGENYNAEMGFVPRTGYFNARPEAKWVFYAKKGIIDRHGPGLGANVFWDAEFNKTDYRYTAFWDIRFRDNSNFRLSVQNENIYLSGAFDPSGINSTPLPINQTYSFTYINIDYRSDRRKKLSYNLTTIYGQYYNGQRFNLRGNIGYRIQPYAQIGVDFNYNHIVLPEPYASSDLYLIGPRIDLTFTKEIFWTTFIQYNNQIDNININTRLQWRFAPVSDLFIVYTDNYAAESGAHKNRALVAKLTYWFNI